MFKVCGTLDLSVEDLKKCIEGAELLSAAINFERARENKGYVFVDESYFVQYAIRTTIKDLEEKSKMFNEN